MEGRPSAVAPSRKYFSSSPVPGNCERTAWKNVSRRVPWEGHCGDQKDSGRLARGDLPQNCEIGCALGHAPSGWHGERGLACRELLPGDGLRPLRRGSGVGRVGGPLRQGLDRGRGGVTAVGFGRGGGVRGDRIGGCAARVGSRREPGQLRPVFCRGIVLRGSENIPEQRAGEGRFEGVLPELRPRALLLGLVAGPKCGLGSPVALHDLPPVALAPCSQGSRVGPDCRPILRGAELRQRIRAAATRRDDGEH